MVNNSNCRNKGTCPLPNSYQTKCIIYKANIDCDFAGYKQKYYLGSHVKQHLKIVSGIIKSRSNMLNIKMIRNYQKTLEKLKNRNGTPSIT